MSVLLLILKIIGIVLLSLLGLIIALVLIVLFVPVRYRAWIDKDSPEADFSARGNVSYLLHIISFWFMYEGEIDTSLKIFGIKFGFKKKSKKSTESVSGEDNSSRGEDESVDSEITDEEVSYTVDWNDEEKPEIDDITSASVNDINVGDKDECKSDEKDILDKISLLAEKLSEKYDKFSGKINDFNKKVKYLSGNIEDQRNKNAVSCLFEELKRLIKYYKPRKLKGFVHFGFDDPALTGKILMYAGILYPYLPRDILIDPGFEDEDKYGNVYLKGHIRLNHLAASFIRVILNKDVRRLWKIIKKK